MMNLTTRIARGKVIYVKPTDASKRAILAREPEWVKRARESRLPVADFTNGSYVPSGSERGA